MAATNLLAVGSGTVAIKMDCHRNAPELLMLHWCSLGFLCTVLRVDSRVLSMTLRSLVYVMLSTFVLKALQGFPRAIYRSFLFYIINLDSSCPIPSPNGESGAKPQCAYIDLLEHPSSILRVHSSYVHSYT